MAADEALGRAAVDLVIRTPDEQDLRNAYGFDGSFLVESELAVTAEGGVLRYEVVAVPPYEKRYGRDAGADLSGYLISPDKAVFFAHLDGSVAGRVVVSEGWNRYAWIEDIAVGSRRRRAGVGRALMNRAVAWAVGRGLAGVRAETQNNNVTACKFYESCGFHLGGFDRDLYRGLNEGTKEVALFWYLPLPSAPPAQKSSCELPDGDADTRGAGTAWQR
jgi:streptothricin acetyltransferase